MMRENSAQKHYPPLDALPYPRNENWIVRESPPGIGLVQLAERIMHVPMGDSPHDRNVRNHEVAHAMWSQECPVDHLKRHRLQSIFLFQATEDARVQKLLTLSGINLDEGFQPPDQLQKIIETRISRGDVINCCLSLVASACSGAEPVIRGSLEAAAARDGLNSEFGRVLKVADEAVRRITKTPLDPQISGKTARWMEKQFRRFGWDHSPRESDGDRLDVKPTPHCEQDDLSLPRSEDVIEAEILALMEKVKHISESPEASLAGSRAKATDSGEPATAGLIAAGAVRRTVEDSQRVAWGELRTEEPRRVLSLPGRMDHRWRSSPEGTRILALHRILTDNRPFGKKRWVPGGTVLIDVSGSMNLSVAKIWEIVESAPGATVAVYAGDGRRGTLRILARDGRVAAREACRGNGMGTMNVVDGPALRWLARQSRPRIWVSDGFVTGINDKSSSWNTLDAQRIVKQAGITRIPTVGEAVKSLRSMAYPGSRSSAPVPHRFS